jgi:predicted dehydrogenase
MLAKWKLEDAGFFHSIDPMTYYHTLQIKDFLEAITEDRAPLVTGEDGRDTVELFTAIYRAQRDKTVIRFPLPTDDGRKDFDGRLAARRAV